MTTYVQARDALVGKVNTALSTDYPTLKVFWENAVVPDVNTVGDMFVQIEVNFQDEFDTTLAPDTMATGEVNFRVHCREGTGTRAAASLFDYLRNLMKFQIVSGVTLYTPRPGRKDSKNGWAYLDLNAPFSFRST